MKLSDLRIFERARSAAGRSRDDARSFGTRARGIVDEGLIREIFQSVPNLFGHRERRVSVFGNRVHVELRDLTTGELRHMDHGLAAEAEVVNGIDLLGVNSVTGRAILAFDPELVGAHLAERLVEKVERDFGYDARPFPTYRPKYPADIEPISRELLKILADASGVTLGGTLKLFGHKPTRTEFNLAALSTIVRNTPRLREWLEAQLGSTSVDVGLGVTNAILNAVGGSPVGPMVDLVKQSVKLRGELARRTLWLEREEELCGQESPSEPRPHERPPRPQPLPSGRLDDYADEALLASMGGFLIGLLDTEDLETSFSPLFGGLPKAARYGSDGFIAELTRVLAARQMLVMRPSALEVLDRVDRVVIDARLLSGEVAGLDAHTLNFVAAVRDSELDLVVVKDDAPSEVDDLIADEEVTVGSPEERDAVMLETVRRLQREGHVVALIVADETEALLAADIGLGLRREDHPDAPWEADIIGTTDLDDATFLVQACIVARDLVDESVVLAGAGALLGTFVALGRGLEKTDPGKVMSAVDIASVTALANGIRRAAALEQLVRPPVADLTPWHALTVDEVLNKTGSSPTGLDVALAAQRRVEPAPTPTRSEALLRAIGAEIVNPFTPMLTAGAALSATVGSLGDAGMVAAVVALNALLGGVERFENERSVSRLARREQGAVVVLRDGVETPIGPDDVVVGDIVRLHPGDVVPADCRVMRSQALEVDESTMTGESLTVSKSEATVGATAEVAERSSMLYDGTTIAAGEALAIVVAVGENTEASRAARLVGAPPISGVESRLREIAKKTLPVAGLSGSLLTGIGLMRHQAIERIVGTGVGMAVAAVPEGLPILSTTAQMAAARRMAERGVMIRNPRAIEALGRVDVLCVDKTGTLTEGLIRLDSVSDGKLRLATNAMGDTEWAREILAAAVRSSPRRRRDERLPHPTDEAIVSGAETLALDGHAGWTRLSVLPFDPRRGYHAVIGEGPDGRTLTVKGAPEVVLSSCSDWKEENVVRPLDDATREALVAEAEDLAADGLRVLAVASRSVASSEDQNISTDGVHTLVFLGFICLSDPIRETSAEAVSKLGDAGISTVMITGDHPRTAQRIACEAGVIPEVGAGADHACLSGAELDAMSDDELADILKDLRVVARATPQHKVRIVRGFQRLGRTVAMAGDGENDAAAIRMADVGIALGEQSTRAARHAADLVVVDEHIETIVDGIAEGRALWRSVRDAVSILVGGNLGEIGFTLASGLFDDTPALNTRQMLLVNLLTDVAPAIALALRPPSEETLDEALSLGPDRELGEALDRDIIMRAVTTGAGASLAWVTSRIIGSREKASTVALLALVGTQLGQTLAAGNPTSKTLGAGIGSAALMLGLVETPGVSQMFGCVPVGPIGLSIAAGSSALATGASALAPQLQELRDSLERNEADDEPPHDTGSRRKRRLNLSWLFDDDRSVF